MERARRIRHFDPIRPHRSYGVPDRYEFVPNRTADYVNVFDLGSRRCIKRLSVAPSPDVTATTIDGRLLYVAGKNLAVIDLEELRVVRTLPGEGFQHNFYALNAFPEGQRMFLFCGDGQVVVLGNVEDPRRVRTEKVFRVNRWTPPDSSIGGKGHFTADGRRYVNANWHTHSVFSLDLTRDYALTTLVPGGFSKPDDLVMTLDERKGYTASHGDVAGLPGAVQVFDPEAGCITRTIPVGRRPAGLTMSPDGRLVYVTNVQDGSVAAIDTASDTVVFSASAAAEYRAAGVADDHLDIEGVSVSADGRTLYAYAVNYGALVVVDDLGGANRPSFVPGELG